MKERPILFSGPMVLAILDGRKTQTRRIVKPSPISKPFQINGETTGDWFTENPRYPRRAPMFKQRFRCPYGSPGTHMWVRETWADVNSPCGPGLAYRADGDFHQPPYDGKDFGVGPSFNYDKYPGTYAMWYSDLISGADGHGWKPSIHMPRWASRILLRVKDIRVERLQDISEEDAKAEGIARSHHGNGDQWVNYPIGSSAAGWTDPRDSFRSLWASINGHDSWDANPWVWVVSFERIGI